MRTRDAEKNKACGVHWQEDNGKLWFEMKTESTGDMWHIGAALALEPKANVLLHAIDTLCKDKNDKNCLGMDKKDMENTGKWAHELRDTFNEWGDRDGKKTNRVSFLTHHKYTDKTLPMKPEFYFQSKLPSIPVSINYLNSDDDKNAAVTKCREQQNLFNTVGWTKTLNIKNYCATAKTSDACGKQNDAPGGEDYCKWYKDKNSERCIPTKPLCYSTCFRASTNVVAAQKYKDGDNPFPYDDKDEKPAKAYYVSASSYYLAKMIKESDAATITTKIRTAFLDAAENKGDKCEHLGKGLSDLITTYKEKTSKWSVGNSKALPKVLVFIRKSHVHPKLNMDYKTISFISKALKKIEAKITDEDKKIRPLFATIGQGADYIDKEKLEVDEPMEKLGFDSSHRQLENFWDEPAIKAGGAKGRKKCIGGFFAKLQEEGCLFIGYRSGTLDAGAFVGIPTLAFDLKGEIGYGRHEALSAVHDIVDLETVQSDDDRVDAVVKFIEKHIKTKGYPNYK